MVTSETNVLCNVPQQIVIFYLNPKGYSKGNQLFKLSFIQSNMTRKLLLLQDGKRTALLFFGTV